MPEGWGGEAEGVTCLQDFCPDSSCLMLHMLSVYWTPNSSCFKWQCIVCQTDRVAHL